MDDNHLLAFDSPLNQSSYIKVIGVGGGGNNAVNHMFRRGITGVDFIVTNTDMKALNGSPVPNKLVLGHEGLGVGGRPIRARKAAEEKEKEIKELFEHNTKMIFITAGMGGGTGTGAAPVIAKYAKEIKLEVEEDDDPGQILVVAVVTTPFLFEGNRRIQQANEGVEELRKYVDSILVINNEKLRTYGNLVMSDAFSMANDVLLTAVKGIAEIITLNAYVNIDFRDVNTVMEHSGTALMGIGEGEGENRALQAVEQATTSVLLNDNDIAGAKNVLLYFSYGPDNEITMDEMGVVTGYITEKTGSYDTNVIWGTGFDDELGDKVKITLIATGFEAKEATSPEVHVLQPEKPEPAKPVQPEKITEPTLMPSPHKEEKPATIPLDSYLQGAISEHAAETPAAAPAPKASDNAFSSFERKPQPAAESGHRNVIPLDAEGELATANRPASNQPVVDDEIVIKSHAEVSAPVATPQPAPQPVAEMKVEARPVEPAAPAARPTAAGNTLDAEARSRAERIKTMHDLLRNDTNGPQIIESMNPAEITGEKLYEATHSSHSEVNRTVVNPGGSVTENHSLYSLPD